MSNIDPFEARLRITKLGLHICFSLPLALFVIGIVIRRQLPFLASPIASESNAKFLGYLFIAVAVIDGLAAYVLKRRIITPKALTARFDFHPGSFARQLTAAFIPVFILCAMPAVYGLIFYFLGGDLDTYVLISIISPASFLLLKPKEETIQRLADEIFKPSVDSDIKL